MLRLAEDCGIHLAQLADRDGRIFVLDGDLADSDGAMHFAQRHPERFLMAGIAEQNMVSMAAGMASCGLRPWVFSFAAFLCYRAFDQIRVCISQAAQPVALVGSHSGGCSARNGKTHAALNDIALMASLPNMTIWSPACEDDVAFAVRAVAARDKPAYLRLPRRPLPPLPGRAAEARWLHAAGPIALVGTGLGTHLALAAQAELGRRGVEVAVAHCNALTPTPARALGLDRCRIVFAVEDHSTFGGLATQLRDVCGGARVVSLGWPRDWAGQSGDDSDLLAIHGLDARGIADAVSRALGAIEKEDPVAIHYCPVA